MTYNSPCLNEADSERPKLSTGGGGGKGGWQCSSSCHKDLASRPLGISCALEISQVAVSKAIIVGYKLTKTPVARAAHNYLPGFSPISLIPEPRICVSIAVNIK